MNIQPPVKRNNQIWVFSSNESPPHTSNYYTQKQWVDKNHNILKIFVGLSMPFNGFLGDLLLETTKINPITIIILKQREYLNITGMVFKRNNQIWVFSSNESPPHTSNYYTQKQWVDKFDWTFSYRPDSEGYAPYGNIVEKNQITISSVTFIERNFAILKFTIIHNMGLLRR
jgi:hypothetical protein